MPYAADAYRLVVSAPSDIETSDIEAVFEAVGRWNVVYGAQMGAVIVPTHWTRHSAAEHGIRPQASLNAQLIDDADILIALFWHRFGTATGEAMSGTVEEIEQATKSGAYVAVLHCARDIPGADLDADQLQKLSEYLKDIKANSLVFDYVTGEELKGHAEMVINRFVAQSETGAQAAVTAPAGANVLPRIERSQSSRTDARGRLRSETQWRLVLTNTGDEPAEDVRVELEKESDEGELPLNTEDLRPLEILQPGGEASYPLIMFMGVVEQARCRVKWKDARGETQNLATLRLL